MGGWTIYHPSETILCPGTRTDRRRQPERAAAGNRRALPRREPCRHRWGRVIAGQTSVRVRRLDHPPASGPTDVLECPDCHGPIEFHKQDAERAA